MERDLAVISLYLSLSDDELIRLRTAFELDKRANRIEGAAISPGHPRGGDIRTIHFCNGRIALINAILDLRAHAENDA